MSVSYLANADMIPGEYWEGKEGKEEGRKTFDRTPDPAFPTDPAKSKYVF